MAHRAVVLPPLSPNLYLDHTLNMKRGPDGTELLPQIGLGEGDGSICPSVIVALGLEAAWQIVGDEDAVATQLSAIFLNAANVDSGIITARGSLIRAGSQMICSEATVCQSMKLIAKVTATFVHFVKR